MCGRITLYLSPELLAELFGLPELPRISPRFNICPSQQIGVVRNLGGDNHLDFLKWGLVPSWADDPAIGYRLINARSETVFEKRSFRQSIRTRRCLVPASGFYEWQKGVKGDSPYYVSMDDGSPMAFAGIWESWKGPGGIQLESCAILTTAANRLMEPIHDRMPVILHPGEYSLWLDREVSDVSDIQPLFRPYPPDAMTATRVSTLVNSPANDLQECIAPLDSSP